MKLITKELAKTIPGIKETEEQKDPVAKVKLFHPMSSYTAFITEYDPEQNLAFGLVCGTGDGPELGYISITEMEEIELFGIPMERDLYFKEELLSEIRKRY